MRLRLFALLLIGASAPAAAQRESLGIFSQWGAFREARPSRCFAITEPHRGARPQGWKPFVSVSYWPERQIAGQVHVRLSRQKRPQSAVLLRIDGRTFQLVGGGNNAWAPDRRADAEIVAAMRTGIDFVVETRSVTGALVRDQYQLRGAATAIDAAAIACARRGR
jgi:hypothetical protein